MHSGTIVLHAHLARHLGADPLDHAETTRVGTAMLDLYAAMGEFAASTTAERIKSFAAEYRDAPGEQA